MLSIASTRLKRTENAAAGKIRDSNIELLRIIAMCGVIVLHYNHADIGGGFRYVPAASVNKGILYGLEGLFICAVDLFVLITGYFSCLSNKRSAVKAVNLLLQVSVFRGAIYLFDAMQSQFSLRNLFGALLPVNYFVILYVALYMISPYLNLLLSKLSRARLMKFLVLLVFLFSVWPTAVDVLESFAGKKNGLSTIGMYGSDWGYTIVNFVLMYLIGAGLRLLDVQVKKRYSAIVLFGCAVLLAVWGNRDSDVAWSYCNPLVILEAVAAFLFFRQLNFKSRVINTLSQASFTCFLFHTAILWKYGIRQAVQQSALYLAGHIVFTCVTVYLISFCVYQIWNILSKPFMKILDRFFEKKKYNFSVEDLTK